MKTAFLRQKHSRFPRLFAAALQSLILVLALAGCDDGSAKSVAPALASVVPNGGSSFGSIPVTLIGSGFATKGAGDLTVTFGGIAATQVSVLHDTTVSCLPAPGAPGTTVDVAVFNAIGTSLLLTAYTYAPLPRLSAVLPVSGTSLGGVNVTLSGGGFFDFVPGINLVSFDGIPATNVVALDNTTLTCDTPLGIPGKLVDVALSNANGSATLFLAYSNNLVPTLTSVVAPSGSSVGGESISLTGSGFLDQSPGPNSILFGGVPGSNVVVMSDTLLTCDSPAGTPLSSVDVVLSNVNGTATLAMGFLYHPLPTLASVLPSSGSQLGGTPVTLSGAGFLNFLPGPNTILFGGVPASMPVVVDDNTLLCTSPAGALGSMVDVELRNLNGSAIQLGAFLFTTEPAVLSVAPGLGSFAGGDSVTISGTGFLNDGAGANTVLFGTQSASGVVVIDDTTINCVSPAGLAPGPVAVSVTNSNGMGMLPAAFSYSGPPTLLSLSANAGTSLGGSSVTLLGTGFQNFSPGINVVTFGGNAATGAVVLSDTAMTCSVPAGVAGSVVDVVLSNANGSDTLSNAFTYFALPSLASVASNTGPQTGGNTVTLTGSGFLNNAAGSNTLTFGGNAATNLVVLGDSSITCEVPPGVAGTSVTVALSNNNGPVALGGGYSYNAQPTLSAVTPASGPSISLNAVVLTGTGFLNFSAGTNNVDFGATPATGVVVVNDTTINCNAPIGTAGTSVNVVVTNDNGVGTLVSGYSYHALPTVTAVTPASGPSISLNAVVLTGTGFLNFSAGTNTVDFGATPATGVVVVNDTTINCNAPIGTAGTSVNVVVTNDNGVGTLVSGYSYHALPTVTAVTPASGPSISLNAVVLTGTGFLNFNAGTNTVDFGATPATGVVVVNDTTINCNAPVGTAGTSVNVVVTNDNGAGTLVSGYSYHALPTVTAVTPASGPSISTNAVVLTGTGFLNFSAGTNTVDFGASPATGVVVVNDTTINCNAPIGTAGTSVNVVVTNDNGVGTLVSGYSYHALPTVTAVTPASGPSISLNAVVLTGTGFLNFNAGTNTVDFGANPATSVVVVNDTTINCNAPIGTAGTSVNVVVTNDNGLGTLVGEYSYHALPTVTAVTPASGPSISTNAVVLTGTGFMNFSAGTNTVDFGATPATGVVVVNDTTINCNAPIGTAGTSVNVVVTNDNGVGTLVSGYSYHALPTVTAVTPASGPSISVNAVVLTGTGFLNFSAGTNTVDFGATPATGVVVVNDTTINCNAPIGTAGTSVNVVVTNDNGVGTLVSGYSYHALPTVTAVTPASGPSISTNAVVLTGTGFLNFSAGTNTVDFGATPATGVVVVNDTTINCNAPVGTAGTSVNVVVTNDNGVGTLVSGYSYHALPTVTAVTPASGPSISTNAVVLTGTGFLNFNAGTNTVDFGATPATGVVVVNDTTINCNAPIGTAGTSVNVVVTNDNGVGTLVSGYSYHALPTVTAVTPASGPSISVNAVVLTGTGFMNFSAGTNSVDFGANPATGVVVVNDTTINCNAPIGTAGTSVNVVVTNDNGVGTLVGGYGYHALPTLSSVVANSGPSAGANNVTLTGTGFVNFTPGTNAVSFDGNAATSVMVLSDTSITCDVPAGVSCPAVDVVVSNNNGVATLSSAYTYIQGPSASVSTVVVDIPFGALADGVDTVLVSVTVLDACSNPLSGETVSLAASGSGNTLTPASGSTNGSGVFTATLSTTLAESKSISATVNPGPSQVLLNDTPMTEFVWSVATDFYVRTTGNDSNSGSSPADAWLTISKAAGLLTAGERVFVGAGTYLEQVDITGNGSSGSPILFVADRLGQYTGDAGDVLVDSQVSDFTLRINGGDYVTIEGFSVTGATLNADSHGIRVVSAANNASLRDNRCYGNARGAWVDSSDDANLEENIVSNNSSRGIEIDDALNIQIINNLVYNNGDDGIRSNGTSSSTIEGNTIYLNGDDGIDNKVGGTATIRNNICTGNADNGIANGGVATSSYNDSWNNTNGNWSPGGLMGTGDISSDPFYENPMGVDAMLGGAESADDSFHLQVTPSLSPAYNVGSGDAEMVLLSDGTHFGDKITRLDDILDGKSPDSDQVNLGYHYQAGQGALAELDADDGRLVYGVRDTGSKRRPEIRSWDDSGGTWSAATLGFPVGTTSGQNVGMIHRISPLKNGEELLFILSEDGGAALTELDMHRWAGAEWTLEWSSPAIDHAHYDKRGFDLEYESATGDALAVYSINTSTPVYRTRIQGVWSPELSLPLNDGGGPNPDPNSGSVHWIELAPGPNGTEIGLAYVDANDDLVALLWDGSAWDTATVKLLDAGVKTNALTGDVANRAFDAAFESLSGDFLVAWGREVARGIRSAILPSGSSTWDADVDLTSAPDMGEVHFVDLAAEAGTDRIAGSFVDLGDGTERLGLGVWNGTSWLNGAEYDSQISNVNDVAEGDFPGAVGWVGSSGVAVCVYADDSTGGISWWRWTLAGGWASQTDVAISGMGTTESVQIETFAGQNKLMVVLSDSNIDLFGATYDGTTWVVSGSGTAIDPDLTTVESMPFSLDLED